MDGGTIREVKICLVGVNIQSIVQFLVWMQGLTWPVDQFHKGLVSGHKKMGVGKTCIAERFVSETYKVTETTIGALFMTKTFMLDGNIYKFQIWDTAGQEKYRALAPMYYRGAAAAIIVYDITEEDSFNCLKGWIKELQKYGPPDLLVALCGNKCDLGDLREVSFEDAKAFSESCHSIFLETSAKTGQNINELFIEISRSLPVENQDRKSSLVRLPSRRTAEQQQSSKGCCRS